MRKKKRLMETILNHVSKGHAINVDSRFAPGVVMAELRGRCTAKRVPNDTHLLQVELTLESGSRVMHVQFPQSVEHKISHPRSTRS